MQPLGTKVYLLKRYSPSDSFCTFFSESVMIIQYIATYLTNNIVAIKSHLIIFLLRINENLYMETHVQLL